MGHRTEQLAPAEFAAANAAECSADEHIQSLLEPSGPYQEALRISVAAVRRCSGGQEALPVEEITQQFYKILDAVRRKRQTDDQVEEQPTAADAEDGSATTEPRDDAGCGGHPAESVHASNATAAGCALPDPGDSPAHAICSRTLQTAGSAASHSMAAASDPSLPRNSLHRTSAASSGAQVLAFDDVHGFAQSVGLQAVGGLARPSQGPSPSSPKLFDLQTYYYSPVPSSCGVLQHVSPFEAIAAVNTAYNALYGRSVARKSDMAPLQPPTLQDPRPGLFGHAPVVDIGNVDASTVTPRTDSLFALQPPLETQLSVPPVAQAAAPYQQQVDQWRQQCPGEKDRGCVAFVSPHTLAWQPELLVAAKTRTPASMTRPRHIGKRLQVFPTTSSLMRLNMRDAALQPAAPASEGADDHEETQMVDVVMRMTPPEGGDSCTPDYCRALESVAKRPLPPRLHVASSRSVCGASVGGGAGGFVGTTVLGSGWAAVAAASNSVTMAQPSSAVVTGGGGSEASRLTYHGYMALPMTGLPPLLAAHTGVGKASLPPPLAMYAAQEVKVATAGLLNRCLDKGYPLAVIPVEHFAAVMAAAEQHDGQLAFHILSRHCVYYPGVGRHSVSSGGCPRKSSSEPACSGGTAGGSGPKANSVSTASKAAASVAAAAAASRVQQLLSAGDALHILSPVEYQRLQLAAEHDLRHLRHLLVAQPCLPAASGAGVPEPAPGLSKPATPGGRALRQHRRGSSICSETNFSANVLRFQSGSGGRAGPSPVAAPVQKGPAHASGDLSAAQGAATSLDRAAGVRALMQAAHLGNMAQVEFLIENGVDVNAEDTVQQEQQQQGPSHGPLRALAGVIVGAGSPRALHYAAMSGSFGVAQLLLHHGAFFSGRDGSHRKACDLARRNGHDAVAELLEDAENRRRANLRRRAPVARPTACAASAAATSRSAYPPQRSKHLHSGSAPAAGGALGEGVSATFMRAHLMKKLLRRSTGSIGAPPPTGAAQAAPSGAEALATQPACSATGNVNSGQPADLNGDCTAQVVELGPVDFGSSCAVRPGLHATGVEDLPAGPLGDRCGAEPTPTVRCGTKELGPELSSVQARVELDVVGDGAVVKPDKGVTSLAGEEATTRPRLRAGLLGCLCFRA